MDIQIVNEGSVVSFIPQTEEGQSWLDSNLEVDGWQKLGKAVIVEARLAGAIIEGMENDGLDLGGT